MNRHSSRLDCKFWEAFSRSRDVLACMNRTQHGGEVCRFHSSCALSGTLLNVFSVGLNIGVVCLKSRHGNLSAEITLSGQLQVHLVECFFSKQRGHKRTRISAAGCDVIIGVAITSKTPRPEKNWKNIVLSRRFARDLFCDENTEPWSGRARGHKGLASRDSAQTALVHGTVLRDETVQCKTWRGVALRLEISAWRYRQPGRRHLKTHPNTPTHTRTHPHTPKHT